VRSYAKVMRVPFAGLYNSSNDHVTIELIVLQNAAGTVRGANETSSREKGIRRIVCGFWTHRALWRRPLSKVRECTKRKKEDAAGTLYLSRISLGKSWDAPKIVSFWIMTQSRSSLFPHREIIAEFDRAGDLFSKAIVISRFVKMIAKFSR